MVTQIYKEELDYIDHYWNRLIRLPDKKPRNGFLSLPYPYITPNDKKFTYLFYWDSFFMFRGLIGTKRGRVMRYVVDNFIHLYKKYGIIPNFNSHASTDRSQPPFLTSMIHDVFRHEGNKRWFTSRMEFAKHEYMHVWNDIEGSYNHKIEGYDLTKYGDRDVGYNHNAEIESGWDFTSRFYNRCSEFLPVDLNVYLYKYELDFAQESLGAKNLKEFDLWETKSERRKRALYKLCWNDTEGFYFDYDYVHKRQSRFYSLGGFIPLWGGLATDAQAVRMVQHLARFETKHGLVITAQDSMPQNIIDTSNIPSEYKKFLDSMLEPKQWDYPNIWPPIEYLVVIGLLQYGFIDDAKRIMQKSLTAHSRIFQKYHTFFEKIHGVKGDIAQNFHYPNQSGFGWTNAIFYRYAHILEHMSTYGDDSIYEYPMPHKPPYTLAIHF